MTRAASQVLEGALALDEDERALVVQKLLESLRGESQSAVAEAWDEEIERRVAELDAGTVATLPWSRVRERLFRGFE